MRARRFLVWLLILTVTTMVAACQPAQSMSAPPTLPAVMPIMTVEITPAPTSMPAPNPVLHSESGVYLTARIGPLCARKAQSDVECVQPYAGEFVVTAPNGAEVTRVVTDQDGQATVELPPGQYILGVRTESIYPFAVPVKVNVVAARYELISFNLDSGR